MPTSGNVFKHVFEYQEFRQTQLLNLLTKDNAGRHRGNVLYGMRLTPSGTTVTIGSGAIYTHWGTKFFFDAQDGITVSNGATPINTIDLASVPVVGAALTSGTNRPVVVGIIAVLNGDATTPPSITSTSQMGLGGSPIRFVAKVLTFRKDLGQPTVNIEPRDPVSLDSRSAPGNYDDGAVITSGTSAVDNPGSGVSLAYNEVLIGTIVLGAPATGGISTTLETSGNWNPGILYAPARTLVEALTDVVGFDPVLGAIPSTNGFGVADPGSNAALTQTPTSTSGGQRAAIPMVSPKYGRGSGTWGTYAWPSFFRDGDQLHQALCRLDFILRLWLNQSGNQSIVAAVQDNSLSISGQPRMAPLAQLEAAFNGAAADANNNNAIVYDTSADGADPNNRIVRDGKVLHVEGTRTSKASGEGDSLRMAISAIDYAFKQLVENVIGFSATRSQWRSASGSPAGGTLQAQLTAEAAARIAGDVTVSSTFRAVVGIPSTTTLTSADFGKFLWVFNPGVTINLPAPTGNAKLYIGSTQAFTLTTPSGSIITSAGASASTAAIPANTLTILACDGTNYLISRSYDTPTVDSKAPLNSPALTGTPTAPTPPASDSSGRLATTAFVYSVLSSAPSYAGFSANLTSGGTTLSFTKASLGFNPARLYFAMVGAGGGGGSAGTAYDSGNAGNYAGGGGGGGGGGGAQGILNLGALVWDTVEVTLGAGGPGGPSTIPVGGSGNLPGAAGSAGGDSYLRVKSGGTTIWELRIGGALGGDPSWGNAVAASPGLGNSASVTIGSTSPPTLGKLILYSGGRGGAGGRGGGWSGGGLPKGDDGEAGQRGKVLAVYPATFASPDSYEENAGIGGIAIPKLSGADLAGGGGGGGGASCHPIVEAFAATINNIHLTCTGGAGAAAADGVATRTASPGGPASCVFDGGIRGGLYSRIGGGGGGGAPGDDVGSAGGSGGGAAIAYFFQ